jgi:hypothetical protein
LVQEVLQQQVHLLLMEIIQYSVQLLQWEEVEEVEEVEDLPQLREDLVVAAHIPGALPEQARLAKETLAVTPLVVEVDQQVVAAAAPEEWALQETLLKDRVVQERQLLLPEVQSRMQVAAAVVVGM